jgi:hypothetical protein
MSQYSVPAVFLVDLAPTVVEDAGAGRMLRGSDRRDRECDGAETSTQNTRSKRDR